MEDNSPRWSLVAAVAPVAWGSTYYVTRHALPADAPLWGAVLRALPAGLVLAAVARRRPHGAWWWRSVVLGTLNVGAFFVLVYVAAQLLATSVAATVTATSPVVMMLVGWGLLAQRPRVLALLGAGLGIVGVVAMVTTGARSVDGRGVLASVGAMAMSSLGYVLATRWSGGVDLVASTSWQLLAGGLVVVPFAAAVEGGPPHLDSRALLGLAYVTLVATAAAYLCWFAGLRRLPVGTVGLVGLLNPVTGVLLGVVLAGESLAAVQVAGIAAVLAGVLLGQPASARALARARGRANRSREARPALPSGRPWRSPAPHPPDREPARASAGPASRRP